MYLSFCAFQMDRGPARKGALIPNIRSENLKENSFSVYTLTRRNACNCLGCSTSPTDKWRFGFKTVAWRRRNWTEIDYNIIRLTPYFRGQNQHRHSLQGPLLWGWLRLQTDWLSGCDFPSVHCVPQWPRLQQLHCSMVNFKFEDNSLLWSELPQEWAWINSLWTLIPLFKLFIGKNVEKDFCPSQDCVLARAHVDIIVTHRRLVYFSFLLGKN